MRVNALIDTGCNVDLSISEKLANHLGLKIDTLRDRLSRYANGEAEESRVCRLNAGCFLDVEHTDFEIVAFVTKKKHWLDVEVGNKLLSKICVNNKLIMEFDYYENLVKFKLRK